jgi:hypothetical protein
MACASVLTPEAALVGQPSRAPGASRFLGARERLYIAPGCRSFLPVWEIDVLARCGRFGAFRSLAVCRKALCIAVISPKTADACSFPRLGGEVGRLAAVVCGVMSGSRHRLGGRRTAPLGEELPARLVLDLVGACEAAELLGITRSALAGRRRSHPTFPVPVAELRCGPVWLRWQIQAYLAEEQRLGSRGWYGRRVGQLGL